MAQPGIAFSGILRLSSLQRFRCCFSILVLKIVTLIDCRFTFIVHLMMIVIVSCCRLCKERFSGDGGSAQYGQIYHELASFFLHSCDEVLTPLVLVRLQQQL